ncbi:MAG: hypothetical protein WC326_05835 [Candidatus Delongbacteria bacterium]
MRHLVALLALSLALGSARAASYDLPAEWLDTHALVLQAGDSARITGSPQHPAVDLGQLTWLGGSLTLVDCRLEATAGRSPAGLPLVVSLGQQLTLEQTWIQGVPSAIELAGGEVHLSGSTLAATESNIRSTHPQSRLWLQDVNLCASATGLELDSVDTVLIEGALFLTNGTGLRIGAGNQVILRDCLFQGNEWAIRIAPTATPPILEESVDLVDSRYALVENLSPSPIDLADAYVDEPALVLGPWVRDGVDPGIPYKLMNEPGGMLVDDDDVYELNTPLYHVTTNGIPIIPSKIGVYSSNWPFSGFQLTDTILPGHSYCPNLVSSGARFYKVTIFIGDWNFMETR